jgi:hypothetical protein
MFLIINYDSCNDEAKKIDTQDTEDFEAIRSNWEEIVKFEDLQIKSKDIIIMDISK